MPTPYNGHHCWNCWNVSLWIANDEGLYRAALECKKHTRTLKWAALTFISDVVGQNARTPDGARYTFASVRSALAELE